MGSTKLDSSTRHAQHSDLHRLRPTCHNCCCSVARQRGSARHCTSTSWASRLPRNVAPAATSSAGRCVGWWAGRWLGAGSTNRLAGVAAAPQPILFTRIPIGNQLEPYFTPTRTSNPPLVMASTQSSSRSASSSAIRVRTMRCPPCSLLACGSLGEGRACVWMWV